SGVRRRVRADVVETYRDEGSTLIFPDFQCVGQTAGSADVAGQGGGWFGDGDKMAAAESARDIGNIGDSEDIEQSGALPVCFRRVVQDDLLDALIGQGRMRSGCS